MMRLANTGDPDNYLSGTLTGSFRYSVRRGSGGGGLRAGSDPACTSKAPKLALGILQPNWVANPQRPFLFRTPFSPPALLCRTGPYFISANPSGSQQAGPHLSQAPGGDQPVRVIFMGHFSLTFNCPSRETVSVPVAGRPMK